MNANHVHAFLVLHFESFLGQEQSVSLNLTLKMLVFDQPFPCNLPSMFSTLKSH